MVLLLGTLLVAGMGLILLGWERGWINGTEPGTGPFRGGPGREAVVARVRHDFPFRDWGRVLSELDRYGTAPSEPQRDRVQMVVLEWAQGDLDWVRELVNAAKADYEAVLRMGRPRRARTGEAREG